jgi:hypothetical protein
MVFASIEDGVGFGDFDLEALEHDMQTSNFSRETVMGTTSASGVLDSPIGESGEENEISY